MLEIRAPGLLTTVQDGGRPGFGHLGVPVSGACDPLGLAVANILAGNDRGAAALELTLVGPDFRVLEPVVVGVGGADLGGVDDTGRRLRPGGSYRLDAGRSVSFPGPPGGAAGARAYLAVAGGVEVPVVLGSASTCLVAAFGGHRGRALRAGDVVRAGPREGVADQRWPARPGGVGSVVRVLPGPEASGFEALLAGAWTVGAASDRMGLRLEGDPLASPGDGMTLSHGVAWGAVQVPPDGRPIVLLADAQPTGGYPVVAVAIVADRPVLGQLRPGDGIRFQATDAATARAALAAQRRDLDAAIAALEDARRWRELAESAGS